MNEPKIIEVYADGNEYGAVTKEEVIEHCHEEALTDGMAEWNSACEYLSRYTDGDGLCRLDLRELVRADIPDYGKTMAVCIIFPALQALGMTNDIPRDIILGQKPFIVARITELHFLLIKICRMNEFRKRALSEVKETLKNGGSLDECFDSLLSTAPAVGSCKVMDSPDKQEYLPTFKILHKIAKCCSIPYYAETLGEYVKALS